MQASIHYLNAMEPLSLSLSFASVVGLLSDFAAGRDRKSSLELAEFLEWLRFHGHDELRALIEANTAATVSIKAALSEGRNELLSRLATIERLLGGLVYGQGAIGDLAISLAPHSAFPQQAVDILVAFEKAHAGRALLLTTYDGASLVFLGGKGSAGFSPSDERLFEADLSQLVRSDLCEIEYNGRGEKIFVLTRRGAAIAQHFIRSEAQHSNYPFNRTAGTGYRGS